MAFRIYEPWLLIGNIILTRADKNTINTIYTEDIQAAFYLCYSVIVIVVAAASIRII
jgi:hypothetical protein